MPLDLLLPSQEPVGDGIKEMRWQAGDSLYIPSAGPGLDDRTHLRHLWLCPGDRALALCLLRLQSTETQELGLGLQGDFHPSEAFPMLH